jgi:hypothetical protein
VRHDIHKLIVVLAMMFALAFIVVGCGNSGGSNEAGGAGAGCLNPNEVREEVDRVAEGAESSPEEVEAKQEAIQAIEAESC